jgi:uncharacterized membrane-anchored protein YjiN (DUF445 family)
METDDRAMSQPNIDQRIRALRRMKLIATGAFLLMTLLFFVTEPLGHGTIVWVIRWDHINAFAEASMVGALADWFAVVALFRHPLGIPIWHTAIIPRKKEEIGRNLGSFIEHRLLSVENLSVEIGRFSASRAMLGYLSSETNRRRASEFIAEAIAAVVRELDDEKVEATISEIVTHRLKELNASDLLGSGLELIVSSGRHERLIDQALGYLAEWAPSRRETIEEFVERSMERMLKWGRKLVPQSVVERTTDQVLTALIEVLQQAAADPTHPMRADLNQRAEEWVTRLKEDPEMQQRINDWKDELVGNEKLRGQISRVWSELKGWLLEDIAAPDSTVRGYVLRAIDSIDTRLEEDAELRATIDERLRSAVLSIVGSYHHEIGALIQRIVDSWDSERLSRELELNLGRDLQYIRLNGTFIGGIVGLLIHLIR